MVIFIYLIMQSKDMKYKFIDEITSDVMFEAYGSDLKELFENSAEALFKIICKIEKVKATKEEIVEIKADNLKDLMFDWLQQLIALVDIKNMFFSKFKILEINENHLKAKIYGEEIKPETGETVVKAVTNHKYELKKEGNKYKVRVIVDI